jgi:hypothetical protein
MKWLSTAMMGQPTISRWRFTGSMIWLPKQRPKMVCLVAPFSSRVGKRGFNSGSGRGFSLITKLMPILDETGFVNGSHQKFKVPLGTWPADKKQKEIGAYVLLSGESGFEAFGIDLFTNVLEMSPDESATLIKDCILLARSRNIHSYSMQ